MHDTQKSVSVFAPAKLNLYLHITGKREDGYHLLDSLVCFTDIGDQIIIESAKAFSFVIKGPFAQSFTAQDKDPSPQSSNLVPRAVWALSKATGRKPDIRITLVKNIPLGSGIGGGSIDAAATLWGLNEWWGLSSNAPYLDSLMLELGSDVPVSFQCLPMRMRGIGEALSPAPDIPELHALFVHCGKPSGTIDAYKNFSAPFRSEVDVPDHFESTEHFIDFLKSTDNMLTEPALKNIPDIAFVLDTLQNQHGTLISRMSGSGSTCFALFKSEEDCFNAAENIIRENPLWWVRTGTINRPQRY